MNKKTVIILFLFQFGLFFGNLSGTDSGITTIHLKDNWAVKSAYLIKESGEVISAINFKTESWFKTSVPTTVLTALVKNGVYPDPYIGMNNMKIPDASEEFNQKYDLGRFTHLPDGRNPWLDPYWFRTEFTLPEELKG
ncbi:MAG: glycoside hydrolase family 2, partial [Candidatus Aminicenantes bacterium]|nr:glycoside hydrolase family 2 [Candidatus Aminicenantes bacterium]